MIPLQDAIPFWIVIALLSAELVVSYVNHAPPTPNNIYRLKVAAALVVVVCLRIIMRFIERA